MTNDAWGMDGRRRRCYQSSGSRDLERVEPCWPWSRRSSLGRDEIFRMGWRQGRRLWTWQFRPPSHPPVSCHFFPLAKPRWKSPGKGIWVIYGVDPPSIQDRATEGQTLDPRASRRMSRTCGIDTFLSAWRSNITEIPCLVQKQINKQSSKRPCRVWNGQTSPETATRKWVGLGLSVWNSVNSSGAVENNSGLGMKRTF